MIKLHINGYDFTTKLHIFHGGEVNVNVLDSKQMRLISNPTDIAIQANIRNSDDVMELLLVKDAIDEWLTSRMIYDAKVVLHLPYLPYARQDRICNKGESFSLRVFANLINNMNFATVFLYDAHSSVSTALINNSVEFNQKTIIGNDSSLSNKLNSGDYVIVAPDAGSEKKASEVAKFFKCDMIRASKRRDMATGKILEIGFIDHIPENRSFLIVDDICDGGGTFLPLAGELKDLGLSVDLYVTHGIFSKGTQILLENFDTVHTTDSFYEGESTTQLQVIKL